MASYLETEAKKLIGELYSANKLTTDEYNTIFDALDDIPLLRDRDEEIEELWAQLEDVPMNPETERLEADFFIWGPGVTRDEVWHWFDRRHSKGVAYLLYGEEYEPAAKQVAASLEHCFECLSRDCVFNCKSECRYALVSGAEPQITDNGGCTAYTTKF